MTSWRWRWRQAITLLSAWMEGIDAIFLLVSVVDLCQGKKFHVNSYKCNAKHSIKGGVASIQHVYTPAALSDKTIKL